MGYIELAFKLPTDYSEKLLRKKITKELKTDNFSYLIENKSLDARNKRKIHWLIKVGITSESIQNEVFTTTHVLNIPYKQRKKKAIVVGSGPAGFFAAFVLQKAGIQTTLIERGTDVDKRSIGIKTFETTGIFDSVSNYAFGEGGAGTFSDGKLTSRTKRISAEKQFILSSYVQAGAPAEIEYMTHPHLGSDNLKIIVKNLRKEFINLGGNVHFETFMNDITVKNGKVINIQTETDKLEADYFIIAPGHSAYETYKMLMKNGVPFRTKNFAIGCRIEHPQELINQAQWGCTSLPGVKAAEYRLTAKSDNGLPVYTFCMCPGGIVVPATAYPNANIVNGMSLYKRNNKFSNAACVAGINLSKIMNRELSPLESINWLEQLDESFYNFSNKYEAPYCSIQGFIDKKQTSQHIETSYPMGIKSAPLWEMLPNEVSNSIITGLKDFSKKLKGFETGTIMGLESKTSSPIQVLRDKNGLVDGFENLHIVGEGSGYSGGIISSGADGIKAAIDIINSISNS